MRTLQTWSILVVVTSLATGGCRHTAPREPVAPGTPVVLGEATPDATQAELPPAPPASPAPVLTPPVPYQMPSTSPTPPIAPTGPTAP